jgi:hypothetical protein
MRSALAGSFHKSSRATELLPTLYADRVAGAEHFVELGLCGNMEAIDAAAEPGGEPLLRYQVPGNEAAMHPKLVFVVTPPIYAPATVPTTRNQRTVPNSHDFVTA